MTIEAPERPRTAQPSTHGDGITLVCPGCGAEVKVRRPDDGARRTRRDVACPFCGTPLEPAPPAEDPAEGAAAPAIGGPWVREHEGPRRIA